MEFIKQLLFGRKIYFNDPVLGKFSTRVKSDNPSINRTWYSAKRIGNYPEDTLFILEGNSRGPNKMELESVRKLMAELPQVMNQVDKDLSQKANYNKFKDWKSSLYLSAVNPYEKGFEVQFEANITYE
ncbi:MAG: hypothetical protein ACFB10_12650, partial [Salibacteraceae bacterium]